MRIHKHTHTRHKQIQREKSNGGSTSHRNKKEKKRNDKKRRKKRINYDHQWVFLIFSPDKHEIL